MVLGIDASRAVEEHKTGVGWYCHYLLRHLAPVIPSDVRVVLYSDAPLPKDFPPLPANWEERVLHWPPIHSSFIIHHSSFTRWPLWSQVRLAERVLRDRPDVFFVPAHVIPFAVALTPRSRRPHLVTTIHDVAFRAFPEAYPPRERWYANHATQLAVRHADRIITPTVAVRDDLVRFYGATRDRIVVVHHGVEHSNTPNDSEHSDTIRSIRMFTGRLLLYVGRLERKKNVVRIVEAFDRIAGSLPDVQLALAGSDGHGAEEVHGAIARSPFRDRIAVPGWVDGETYRALLHRATVLCFPTLSEGFGMPILEAMAAGVPVITSRGNAHEEVAGDAALLVSPDDTHAIADAIACVLRDDGEHARLVAAGRHRAAQFTWDRAARETWSILRSVLSI